MAVSSILPATCSICGSSETILKTVWDMFVSSSLYLICGTVAALTQAMIDPGSEIPMIGASGAVSGILGAYLLLYIHDAKVLVVFPIIIFIKNIPDSSHVRSWFMVFDAADQQLKQCFRRRWYSLVGAYRWFCCRYGANSFYQAPPCATFSSCT